MTPRKRLRVAFAGGGTGGHIVPGLHLLERSRQSELRGEDPNIPALADLVWFTSGREVEDRVLLGVPEGTPWQRQVLDLEPPGGGAPSHLRLLRKTFPAVLRARRELRRHGTEVLVGLGGFTTLPAVLAARSLGLPVALLEINASPGKATRSLARFSNRIFHAWRGTLPSNGEDGRHVLSGAPVSPAVTEVGSGSGSQEAALEELGMDPERPLLLVLGGSQGAGSLNDFVGEHHAEFQRRGLQVLHQCGPGRRESLPPDGEFFRVTEFLSPVAPALQAATLVLCRGGASTLAEVAAARKPALVVPYPHHADRHQERNANELGSGIELVQDDELNPTCVERLVHLSLESGVSQRASMTSALEGASRADASGKILAELRTLVETNS